MRQNRSQSQDIFSLLSVSISYPVETRGNLDLHESIKDNLLFEILGNHDQV